MSSIADVVGRVGIITLPGNFNYGNRLQLYAGIRIFADLGFVAESLVFNRRERLFAHPNRMLRILAGKPAPISQDSMRPVGRVEAFRRFGQLIPERTYQDLSDIPVHDFAFFAVGSDQVWNPNGGIVGGNDSLVRKMYHALTDPGEAKDAASWLFLKFADKGQRIAFAPSIGADNIDVAQGKWLADGVAGFERLSVREERGAQIIHECSGRDAEVICDPTLAVEQGEWATVADDCITPNSEYVFAYLLGDNDPEAPAALSAATRGGNLPIIRLSDKSRPDEPDAGPAEFVSLVANAAHVVTDSFHAAVFASIFERPLTIVRRAGQGRGAMFSRLEGLTGKLGIGDKILDPGASLDLVRAADYDGVSNRIAAERERFMTYLEGCIDG